MINGRYQFSSVQIKVPILLAGDIMHWGDEHVNDQDLFIDHTNMHYGREDDLHITILYNLYTNCPADVARLINIRSFEIQLGKVSFFTVNDQFDVLKIDVFSEELHKLHKNLTQLPTAKLFPSYKPHVTIAFLRKGSCRNLMDNTQFCGYKWDVDSLLFSSKTGDKTPIQLRHSKVLIS